MKQAESSYLDEVYPEITIKYDDKQKSYYKKDDKKCLYPQWKKRYGIHKVGGNFPAMVAKYHYEKKGYIVVDDYCLVRMPKKREDNEGYKLLCKIFGLAAVRKVINNAEAVLFFKGMGHGGDPDLFVYKANFSECFFVEAKEPPDNLRQNQRIVMHFIRHFMCPVYVVKIIEA